jgi:hypothetical protein
MRSVTLSWNGITEYLLSHEYLTTGELKDDDMRLFGKYTDFMAHQNLASEEESAD